MPVIKSAKKKLRKDRKREAQNKKFEESLEDALKKARKHPSEKSVQEAIKRTDKAVKKHIIHKNKAARIKSSLAKLLPKTQTKKAQKSKIPKTKPSRTSKK